MSNSKIVERKADGIVAVAIDEDKGSRYALKWAVDHLLSKGQTVTLVHVTQRLPPVPNPAGSSGNDDSSSAQKKEIHCNDVLLEESDVAKGIIEYVTQCGIDTLVVGACTRGGFLRGEKAFCSVECRCQQILSDEYKEKCRSGAMKPFNCSVSPCSAPRLFTAGVAAA